MIYIGIAFIFLIIVICLGLDDKENKVELSIMTAVIGITCVFAAFIVKCDETTEAVNLYKQGKLKETVTIKQVTELGQTKIDTLYTYSRP